MNVVFSSIVVVALAVVLSQYSSNTILGALKRCTLLRRATATVGASRILDSGHHRSAIVYELSRRRFAEEFESPSIQMFLAAMISSHHLHRHYEISSDPWIIGMSPWTHLKDVWSVSNQIDVMQDAQNEDIISMLGCIMDAPSAHSYYINKQDSRR